MARRSRIGYTSMCEWSLIDYRLLDSSTNLRRLEMSSFKAIGLAALAAFGCVNFNDACLAQDFRCRSGTTGNPFSQTRLISYSPYGGWSGPALRQQYWPVQRYPAYRGYQPRFFDFDRISQPMLGTMQVPFATPSHMAPQFYGPVMSQPHYQPRPVYMVPTAIPRDYSAPSIPLPQALDGSEKSPKSDSPFYF